MGRTSLEKYPNLIVIKKFSMPKSVGNGQRVWGTAEETSESGTKEAKFCEVDLFEAIWTLSSRSSSG